MLIRVKVFPNSKKEGIFRKSNNNFDVLVREKPIGGLANGEAIEALARYLNIPKSKIRLIRGHKQRNKIFEIGKN